MLDKLPTPATPITATAISISNTPAGQKEQSYSGIMAYETDGAKLIDKAFRMATNAENAPYAEYAAAIEACLVAGGALNIAGSRCPGYRSKTFDHRRFSVTMLQSRRVITGDEGAESSVQEAKSKMLVPMSSRIPGDIRACAIALREVPATLCLGYRGEWDKRFSSKNAAALPA
jgi:hypothetical protein